MAVIYTPHFAQFFTDNGVPLNGGKLYTYLAGTTTPKATYTTAAGDTANANPIILDSSGRATLFLDGSYKFRLEDSLGNLIEETDNVTAFAIQTGGSNLTSALNFASGGVVASASTTDIWNIAGNIAEVSGTGTITSFGTAPQAGAWRLIRFSGAATITNNASIRLQGASNIVANVGDYAMITAYSTTIADVQFFRLNGTPIKNSVISSTRTGAYTVLTTDDYIPCDATSAGFTLTLYTAVGNAGKTIEIEKIDSSFNVVTIDGAGTETINGALTKRLSTQWEKITLVSNGTNWYIKERYIPNEWTTYTTTLSHSSGGITNNTNSFRYRRIGDSIEIMGTIVFSGASAAFTGLFFTLPSGLTIDTGKMTTATNFIQPVGQVNFLDSGVATNRGDALYVASSGTIEVQYNIASTANVSGGSTTNAAPFTYGASDAIGITTHRIPVTNWEG